MIVSVVIPCRNEAAYIEAFLASLAAQEMPNFTCEFLIADGMSDDGTRNVLEMHRSLSGLRIIDNPEKVVSTGLNRAILAAQGEIIVRMDVHTEYAGNYIAMCVKTLLATGAANAGGPMRNVGKGYVGEAIAAAFHSAFSCGGARFHQQQYEGWVDTVTYGCWRKKTLLDAGLFDVDLVRNQDDELNLRLTRAGGRIWQSPEIVMAYHPRSSLKKLFIQYFQYGFWKVAVIRKHRIPASWRHVVPGLAVLGFIAAPLMFGFLQVAGFRLTAHGIIFLWTVFSLIYLLASAVASASVASRRSWTLIFILPVIFATYHFAYGIGFLAGLLMGKRMTRDVAINGRVGAIAR